MDGMQRAHLSRLKTGEAPGDRATRRRILAAAFVLGCGLVHEAAWAQARETSWVTWADACQLGLTDDPRSCGEKMQRCYSCLDAHNGYPPTCFVIPGKSIYNKNDCPVTDKKAEAQPAPAQTPAPPAVKAPAASQPAAPTPAVRQLTLKPDAHAEMCMARSSAIAGVQDDYLKCFDADQQKQDAELKQSDVYKQWNEKADAYNACVAENTAPVEGQDWQKIKFCPSVGMPPRTDLKLSAQRCESLHQKDAALRNEYRAQCGSPGAGTPGSAKQE